MRRLSLLLCALLLALGASTPAYGAGITDVPPTIISNSSTTLTVYERTQSVNFLYTRSYGGGVWQGTGFTTVDIPVPFYGFAGNIAVNYPGNNIFMAVLANGALWCGIQGLSWTQMTAPNTWSTVAGEATPAILAPPGNVSRVAVVDVAGVIRTADWSIGQGCRPEGLGAFSSTGGNTSWTPGIAGTNLSTDELMVALGTDTRPYWSYNGGPWQLVNPVGGAGAGAVALTTWGGGRYDLFVRGTDGQLWHNWNNQGWEALGGAIITGPGCTARRANWIDCVAIGQEGDVWLKTWDGVSWNPWVDLGSA